MKVFQITNHHYHFTKVSQSEVGLWCFVYKGQYYGFCETEQEAIAKAKNFDPRKDAAIEIRFQNGDRVIINMNDNNSANIKSIKPNPA